MGDGGSDVSRRYGVIGVSTLAPLFSGTLSVGTALTEQQSGHKGVRCGSTQERDDAEDERGVEQMDGEIDGVAGLGVKAEKAVLQRVGEEGERVIIAELKRGKEVPEGRKIGGKRDDEDEEQAEGDTTLILPGADHRPRGVYTRTDNASGHAPDESTDTPPVPSSAGSMALLVRFVMPAVRAAAGTA